MKIEPGTATVKRREFIKQMAQGTAAISTTAISTTRVLGANERVGVGVIGFGLIGRIHTRSFQALPDAQVVAVAETFQPRLAAAGQLVGSGCQLYHDFRRLLEDRNVDVVVVATPDHWHALMTLLACAAGKDVYVEKPVTLFVREGRWMVNAAKRFQRVVQVGTQQRSGPHYQRARDLFRQGGIGDLVSVQCNFFRNVAPGFGKPPDQNPPKDLNYDLWLGPAPRRPYNPNRAIYHFRWFWDYSGGQMTNLGHHSLDVAHWFTGVGGAQAIASAGGRFFLKDNCEVPDVQDTVIEYPGFHATVQVRECTMAGTAPNTGGLVFHGTKGTMLLGRDGFEVIPDKKDDPVNIVARIMGGHPVGGPQPVRSEGGQFWASPAKDVSGERRSQLTEHAQNFIASVKSRKQPISDLESGHQVSTVCHLANIAMKLGRKLRWNAATEEIEGDAAASALLVRPYREPWDAELRALGVT